MEEQVYFFVDFELTKVSYSPINNRVMCYNTFDEHHRSNDIATLEYIFE